MQELQLEGLLGRHVAAGPGAVADLDGQLGSQVGRDECLLDLLPGLVVRMARAEQAADALGEAQPGGAQGVLEQDAAWPPCRPAGSLMRGPRAVPDPQPARRPAGAR